MTDKSLVAADDEDFGFDMSDMMMPFMMIMLLVVMQSIITPVQQIAQSIQSQSYTGQTDNRTLNAIPIVRWLNLISDPPYTGWVSVSFVNNGPNSAFIGINNPDEMHETAVGDVYSIDFTGAQRRIEFVFYKANAAERATVETIAKY